MKILKIKDEKTMVMIDMDTNEVIDTFKYDLKEEENENEKNDSQGEKNGD